jgi:hypothetical protein
MFHPVYKNSENDEKNYSAFAYTFLFFVGFSAKAEDLRRSGYFSCRESGGSHEKDD